MSEVTLRVLVVDDERSIADSLTMILRLVGYDVRKAYSGDAALVIAQTFRPHALVAEINMPHTSGLALAMWFEENLPSSKVLLLSGRYEALPTLEDAIRRGYHHYNILPKPVHPTKILDFVASCGPAAGRQTLSSDPTAAHPPEHRAKELDKPDL